MLRSSVIAIVLAIACVIPGRVPAEEDGTFAIDRAVIASGGAVLSGGAFRLSGTVGQSTTAALAGDAYRLNGGFWHPVVSTDDRIFANGFDP